MVAMERGRRSLYEHVGVVEREVVQFVRLRVVDVLAVAPGIRVDSDTLAVAPCEHVREVVRDDDRRHARVPVDPWTDVCGRK